VHLVTDLGPIATRVLFENDRVRVWENVLEPGEESAVHRHDLDYLIVDLAGDRIAARPAPDDTSGRQPIEAPVRAGQVVYLRRGSTETAVNTGQATYRTILIELKDPG
jgi:beta-alanine degradation protein BauB